MRKAEREKNSAFVDGTTQFAQSKYWQYLFRFALLAVFAYALIAGLRTVADLDLGWQLATGRWIVEHHAIPRTDVFSYTARGQEWIYPVLSQVLLYLTYAAGGYALLSWLGAAACVGTVALQLRHATLPGALLALIGVPLIALRTAPRADMFSELLIAAFLGILWHYYRNKQEKLWLLPLLMLLWVNLHPGFIAGLAICIAYVGLELFEIVARRERQTAVLRLRRAAPYLFATIVATLVNPWGIRIYLALVRQASIQSAHSAWVREWAPVRINIPILLQHTAEWREPGSAGWWMLAIALVTIVCAVCMRRFGPALLLAASAYVALHAARMSAPFATVMVIVAGSLLADAFGTETAKRSFGKLQRLMRAEVVALVIALCIASFAGIRIFDLVTNRYYLRASQKFTMFGTGPSYWYPFDAANFVRDQHLPKNIFHPFSSGGFLLWALGTDYPDYIDGRSVPFGEELLFHTERLLSQPLDSPAWQKEADQRDINTVFVNLDPELNHAPNQLLPYCTSQSWRPVYMDEQAAIFVRVSPENAALIDRLQIDCRAVQFSNPPMAHGMRGRAEAFHYYLNTAYIFLALGRPTDALTALDSADSLFSESAFVHFARGYIFQKLGRWEQAERELTLANDLGSGNAAPALASQYQRFRRYTDEVRILSRSAELSGRPSWLYLQLGYALLANGQAAEAVAAFEKAGKYSPFDESSAELGESFWQKQQEGLTRARQVLGAGR